MAEYPVMRQKWIGLLVGGTALAIILYMRKRKTRLPPGPPSLPLIGTIYYHGIRLTLSKLRQLRAKYGDIFCLSIGAKKVIVLNSFKSIREAMARPEDFANRGLSDKPTWRLINPNMEGFAMRDYDEMFLKTRNLSMTILHRLGGKRAIIQDTTIQEANALLEIVGQNNGNFFCPSDAINTSVVNILLRILINKRCNHGDERLATLMHQSDDFSESLLYVILIDSFPILRFIPPIYQMQKTFIRSHDALSAWLWQAAQGLVDRYEEGEDSTFVQCYAEEHYDSNRLILDMDVDELRELLYFLLIGGLEVTAATLKWILVYLANRQDVQQKLYEEIVQAVGSERAVVLEDRHQLPYLEAVVYEAQRCSTAAPLHPHVSNLQKDVQLFDYIIPKGTMILINLFNAHHDTDTWPDARMFRPERFINSSGKFEKHENVIPFSVGNRSCPGELLGQQELYLLTARMFQKFKFSPSDNKTIDETPVEGFILHPKPFTLKAEPR